MRAFARLQASGARPLWRAMRRIEAPTLVLWGDTDRLIPARHAVRVGRTIRDARVRVFEQTGHVAMMEHPEATARAIVALLGDSAATE
jgi:pimeloyl-ACP methyl ester carboxylesterase